MKIKDIIRELENIAPISMQESFDNSGLLVGDKNIEANGALLTIDTTEEVIDEAINKGCNLIISHHPIIFSGLKSITGKNYVERTILKAIKNDIAIYAMHTNIDSHKNGVSKKICEKLNLRNCKVLSPVNNLKKLVSFVPVDKADEVKNAIYKAGAGAIGNYSNCSFNIIGEGTFLANDNTNPYVGKENKLHTEKEIRFETIFPDYLKSKVISALVNAHPYEEVAYDIYNLENKNTQVGLGMVGELELEINEKDFLKQLKIIFGGTIRHTKLFNKKIKKVAVCGGSCDFLLSNAINSNADVYISSDFKYHKFFDAENKIIIADIGHYETEQFTKEIFFDILTKKISNFAIHFSEVNTNPINYY